MRHNFRVEMGNGNGEQFFFFVADPTKKVQEDIYSNMSDEVLQHNLALRTDRWPHYCTSGSTLAVRNNRERI